LEIALQYDGIQFATFSPTKPMPTDLWWEKAYAQYSEVDQFIEELYHARANHHAKKISFDEPLVLGDRSILTSFVTRWPQKSKLHEYIQHTGSGICSSCSRYVIYLDLPIEVTLQRLANRERNYGLRDEQIERLIQAKMAYRRVFKFKNELGFTALKYQYVDANQNETELFSQVYNLVKNNRKSMNFQ
jgi:thymidylate kinase